MPGDSGPALAFLFTDVQSSTRLWERFADAMASAIERHDAILRRAVTESAGVVVKTTGDGLMAVFPSASAAAAASLDAQRALHSEQWRDTGALAVRMGIHVGPARERDGDYFGPAVNRTARIMAAGHGGQVLLSANAAELARRELPEAAELRDLGEHRLKDLAEPERLYQLVYPGLPTAFPPLATLSARPNNLPTQTSAFLGREAQLSEIRRLLDSTETRLLTLTGPGGIGKTRLALQAVANQIDRFDDGAFLVDLSSAHDGEAAFQLIVQAVGVRASQDEPPLELLREYLRTRTALLLLDNFEHVVEAAPGVAELLRDCPALTVVATSREALRVRGERLLIVPPLALPEPAAAHDAGALAGYEAVRLFVERAGDVVPGFALDDTNAAVVAGICARLDGLPLAIELAAARLTLFSPEELLDRLGHQLDVLRGGARDLPERQQTLRRTIEWSHALLDADDRLLFALLSVFVGARVEAVEAVAAQLEPFAGVDVVDGLASLVGKSLVRPVEGEGGRRLSMLESIREFAAERLGDDGELAPAAARAHADHFAGFAGEHAALLAGPERETALDELGTELGNLLAAWRYWVDAGDVGHLNALLDSLWSLYDARGWYRAAVELANDLLGVLPTVAPSPERTHEEIALYVSLARGVLATHGYTEEVEAAYSRALAISAETGDLPQRSPVLRGLASFHLFRGEFERSAEIGQELLALAETGRDRELEVEGRLVVGSSFAFLGEIEGGLAHLERAIELSDPVRHTPGRFRFGPSPTAVAHTTSAILQWLRGYPDLAVRRADAAVVLAERLNHPYTLAFTLFHVAFLDLWRGELSLVDERARRVLSVAERHSYPIWRAVAVALEGAASAGLGKPVAGVARVEEGIALYEGQRTPAIFWPLVLSLRARAFGLGGRPADGVAPISEAIEIVGEQSFLYPEFALLKGELLLGSGDDESALHDLRAARAAAAAHGLRLAELRAAIRLARVAAEPGEEIAGLRTAYDALTEGFDTRDLVEARALLDAG